MVAMPEPCLLDNDVALKIAAFQLRVEAVSLLTIDGKTPAILGVGRYVISRKAKKSGRFHDPASVSASLDALLNVLVTVEPSPDEIELAADLEAMGRRAGAEFDVGEAQLLAILLSRGTPALVTGDKRAVAAMPALGRPEAAGKVLCFEQLLSLIAKHEPASTLRAKICGEPEADRTASVCFACASVDTAKLQTGDVLTALQSYVDDLRARSGNVLMADASASALTA